MEIWRLATCGHGLHRSSYIGTLEFIYLTKNEVLGRPTPLVAFSGYELCRQIGIFVADVTSVLNDEESEAMKRYAQSAMGKSFSRKTLSRAVARTSSKASTLRPGSAAAASDRPSVPDLQ